MPKTNQQRIDWPLLTDLAREAGYTFERLSLEMGHCRSWLTNAKRDDKWLENSEIKHICLVLKCDEGGFVYTGNRKNCTDKSTENATEILSDMKYYYSSILDSVHIIEDYVNEDIKSIFSQLTGMENKISAIAKTQGTLLDYAEEDHAPYAFAKMAIEKAMAQSGIISYKDMEKLQKMLGITVEVFQSVKNELGLTQFSKREGQDNHPVSYWKKETGYKN